MEKSGFEGEGSRGAGPGGNLSARQLAARLRECLAAVERWEEAAVRGLGRGRLLPIVKDGVVIHRGEWTDAAGKRRRVHLGTDKAAAELMLTKLVRDRDMERVGLGAERGGDVTLRRIADLYLDDLRTRARPSAYATARHLLDHTIARLPARTVRDLSRPAAMLYRRMRLDEGKARATVNAELRVLNTALAFAVRSDLIAQNPLAGFRAMPVGSEHRRRIARALSDEEIARLVKAAEEYDRERPDLFPRAPLFVALLETGARWAELTTLTRADVDLERAIVHLRGEHTKTGAPRILPLTDAALAAFERTIQAARELEGARIFRRGDGTPWPAHSSGGCQLLYRLLKRAGIPRATPDGVIHVHALRHTFATRLARCGVPISHAQALTGHRSARMLLEVYTHLGVADLRQAVARISGDTLPPH